MSGEDRADIERDSEQAYITGLYERLDELRQRASDRLAGTLRQVGGTPAARTEREALTVMYRQQLAQLDAAENGLCFGRLEFNGGAKSYIGRLGMHADNDDYDQLLMDWRADAARPFYLATAASPGDVRVRRHIKTRARTVQRLDDEVLDLTAADPSKHEGLTGESALLAALTASRTGRMRDIVETIQAEQDRIIRSGLPGVLVVQGGPGTGKTAVALHRAAYLLYSSACHTRASRSVSTGWPTGSAGRRWRGPESARAGPGARTTRPGSSSSGTCSTNSPASWPGGSARIRLAAGT